jgi:hypothetical protein
MEIHLLLSPHDVQAFGCVCLQKIMSVRFNPNEYSEAVAALLLPEREAALDGGVENIAVRERLAALTDDELAGGRKVVDRQFAAACRAGLWLYHDFLDESHRISQEIETTTGSFWHGIMHRRERDYDNAKYWFRRVGQHPTFPSLATAMCELVNGSAGSAEREGSADLAGSVGQATQIKGVSKPGALKDSSFKQTVFLDRSLSWLTEFVEDNTISENKTAVWDPYRMVDACETAVRRGGPAAALLRQVQQAEWKILFDYCFQGGFATR